MSQNSREDTELDKLLADLSESERVTFLQIYCRVFRETDPNDELLTIFRALVFCSKIVTLVPGRLAQEREQFQKLLPQFVSMFEAVTERVDSALSTRALDVRKGLQELGHALAQFSEVEKEFEAFAEWMRSTECLDKHARGIATRVGTLLQTELAQLNSAASDLKAESINLAAKAYAREENLLAIFTAAERQRTEADVASRRRPVNLSVFGASAVVVLFCTLGFIAGAF